MGAGARQILNNSTRRKISKNLIIAQPGIIAQAGSPKFTAVCFYVMINFKTVDIFKKKL